MAHAGQMEFLYSGKSFSGNAFKTALETLISEKYSAFYMDNYDNLFRENQADFIGLSETKKIIKAYNKNLYERWSDAIEAKLEYYEDKMYSHDNQSNFRGKTYKTEMLLSVFAGKSIQKDPTLLEQYPILQKAYNLDGTKKGIIQLIEERDNAISKTKDAEIVDDLYYAIADYRVENSSEDIDAIMNYVQATGRQDKFVYEMFQATLERMKFSKESIKEHMDTLHGLARLAQRNEDSHIQVPQPEESTTKSNNTIQENTELQSEEAPWMDTMKGFSDKVTEIEGYAKKQGEMVQAISMAERQKEEQRTSSPNIEDTEK